MAQYTLHYAPDNASLVVRLVLEELGQPYETKLVDRSVNAQHGADYKFLNPVGRIPALETPDGPIFETAAICLWLADRHGGLAPSSDHRDRGAFLSWLFFLSNTVHAELRTLFYPATIAGPDPAATYALSEQTKVNLARHYALLDQTCPFLNQQALTLCDLYIAPLLRWPALYPLDTDRSWFDLSAWPNLKQVAQRVENRPSAQHIAVAEGLGPHPFSHPSPPNPPEGSGL